MLPTLSRLSVSLCPDSRLRHWCSSRSLRISPLHREFRYPLHHSSPAVSKAGPALKTGVSLQTYKTTYAPFTPSHSGQRLLPTYYRGCWHVVCRGFLVWYRHYLPTQQSFTSRGISSLTRRRWVRVSPIAQYSPLLPPVGVWTVSQFQCGRSTSQSGYPSWPGWAVTPPTS